MVNQALELEKFESVQKVSPNKSLQHTNLKDPQVLLFNPPKPHPTCDVCVEMQKKQYVTPNLLHLSAHPTGCPAFIEMNIISRDKVATALKLCKSCLRPNTNGHEKSCIVFKLKNKKNKSGKTKYEFTCRDDYCYRHMWLCSKHKPRNQESMDKKATDLQQKYGLRLIHFLGCSRPSPSIMDISQGNHKQSNVAPKTNLSAANKSFKVAQKKLKRKSASTDSNIEIVPIPSGQPMFMFQALKGKTKPVNAFYDSGCSNACLRVGIPGVELQGKKLASMIP